MTRLGSRLRLLVSVGGLAAIRRSRECSRSGEIAARSNDWAAAQQHFREALGHDSSRWRIWVQLGHAAKEQGDLVTAEAAYRCALELNGQCSDTLNHLAHLLKRLQRWQEAQACFLRLTQLGVDADAVWPELLIVGRALADRDASVPTTDSRFSALSKMGDRIDGLVRELSFLKSRAATYLGHREALTYLVDETPLFVNTDDIGGPMNLLNGGRYEEGYFSVLNSYRRPDSVFVDIGANLGVYSLRFASRLRAGKVLAFEPNARMRALFSRSVYLNGRRDTITIHPHALSDYDGSAVLEVPADHAGGGHLRTSLVGAPNEGVSVRQLDSLMPAHFRCDLVKIDVEGHELRVLRGMQAVLRRSPDCVVLFEKLAADTGIERGIFELSGKLGWCIYAIDGVTLLKQTLDAFRSFGGYFLAGQAEVVESGGLTRSSFYLYPQDLLARSDGMRDGVLHLSAEAPAGALLCNGPYWFLPMGMYRFSLEGDLDGEFRFNLCAWFGIKIGELVFAPDKLTHDLPVDRDLCNFELVLRSDGSRSKCKLKRIRVTRLG